MGRASRLGPIHLIRATLLDFAERHPGEEKLVLETLRLLQRLEVQSVSKHQDDAVGDAVVDRPLRNQTKSYRTDFIRGQPNLAEYREGNPQPFLVSKSIYEATAAVLSRLQERTGVLQILEAVSEKVGADIPDYQVRTCLRFWRNREPRLVTRVGTKYKAADPQGFVEQAAKAFQSLPKNA